jgi:ATPase family associated with various cellular activities (AAA)
MTMLIQRVKASSVEQPWIDRIRQNLDVYRISALSLPVIEKHNISDLLSDIAGKQWTIAKCKGLGLEQTISNLQDIIKSDRDGILWVVENLGSLWRSLASTDRQTLEQHIIDLAIAIRDHQIAVICVDYGCQLPESLRPLIPQHDLPLPSRKIVEAILREFDIGSARLATICAGLVAEEIRIGLKLALTPGNGEVPDESQIESKLLQYKILKLRELGLEFLGEPDVGEFGGLDRIAQAMDEVVQDYSPKAKALKIALPKGFMFVGPPGTGKTHTAKCIAGQLQWPLISIGIDAVKTGGADLLKILLARIEAAAPCVIYFDEIDKFFTSDTDPQILGVILTWLQEKSSETFVLATANRVARLPVELTRAGRFDRTFWVGFPNELERYQIVKLYAKKYDRAYESIYGRLEREEWLGLLNQTDKFTGAELKSIVDRAAKLDFYEKEEWLKLLALTSLFTETELNHIIQRSIDVDLSIKDNWFEIIRGEDLFGQDNLKDVVDRIFELDINSKSEWLSALDLRDKVSRIDIKKAIAIVETQIESTPLQITCRNLMKARQSTVSLWERNPEGILEIKNQAEKFSEPSSSGNIEGSLFAVERIGLWG